MTIVDRNAKSGVDLLCEIGNENVDVVAFEVREGTLPADCSHILNEYPNVIVVGIDSARRTIELYAMELNKISTLSSSSSELTATIRRAVGYSQLH